MRWQVWFGILCLCVMLAVPFVIPEHGQWVVFGGAVFALSGLVGFSVVHWDYIAADNTWIGRRFHSNTLLWRTALDRLAGLTVLWIIMLLVAFLPSLWPFGTDSGTVHFVEGTFLGTALFVIAVHLLVRVQSRRHDPQ